MNIDFIKWMCEKAEGFEVIAYPNEYYHIRSPWREHSMELDNAAYYFQNNKHDFGYLLQRAIEGVNMSQGRFSITQTFETMFMIIDNSLNPINHRHFDFRIPPNKRPIEQAKESALKYIYEQELK